MSDANISIHNIVTIKPSVSHYSDFTVYEWQAVDNKGNGLLVRFFNTHKDGLSIEPIETNVYEPRKE